MNSRLNSEQLERRGLVYTVETSLALYSDTGLFQVYYACDHDRVDRCAGIVRREIEKLAERPMSDTAFERVKRQICGQLLVGSDNREGTAMTMAKSLLRHGELLDNGDTARSLQSLTPGELCSTARILAEAESSRLVIV